MDETLKAFRIQHRVVGALLMREIITRYGRHNIGFLWLFVEPMLFTIGVTALWTLAGMHRESTIPIVAFAVTGYSSVLMWRNMPGRCVHAIEPNLSLMYHRNVKIIDIFLSRLILELVGATTSFLVLASLFIFLNMMKPPEDLTMVLFGWGMLAWFGMSLALFLGGLSSRSELVEKLWHPMAYLIFPLSGAAFMVEWLPKYAQDLALYVPMVNAMEIVRAGYFGSAVKTHYDLMYLVTWCLVLTALGLAEVRGAGKRIIPE